MLRTWLLGKLEPLRNHTRVLVRDPLHLLAPQDGALHAFARDHAFTVIVASTNLVFRELYEQALADPETRKILVVDGAPARRRAQTSGTKAPPPFYPDLLNDTEVEAQVELDLCLFLREQTRDPLWPAEANDPQYARLIASNLDGVLRAHRNLQRTRAGQFTDTDFETIVGYAALGIPEAAFKKLDRENLWRVGLLGHEAIQQLESLAPQITEPLLRDLRGTPPPFCWLTQHDPTVVLRAFYLALVLSQHTENWRLLLANIDPALAQFSNIEKQILTDAAPDLIRLDEGQADRDLSEVERSLDKAALQLILIDQLKATEPAGFVSLIEKEQYSGLMRGLGLIAALDDLLSAKPARDEHSRIQKVLFPEDATGPARSLVVERRRSSSWSNLKEAYRLATEIQRLREGLASFAKTLKVTQPTQLTYRLFWDAWNGKRINRLEYYVSCLERLVHTADLRPASEEGVPSAFINALARVRQQVASVAADVQRGLDEVNSRFQEAVALQYPGWLASEGEVYLTSQFIRRCLKAHWDPDREKAVVFIFDGMRYDIWDELLRPMLLDRLEVVADLPASALLPSETHISRWALSAGCEPDHFWPPRAENEHLAQALRREFNYGGEVEVVEPEGSGSGETVRYRAGNLGVYIFELCDKELHKIRMRTLPDGRQAPARPLAFIYQQHLKSIIDTEVMAIVRNLPAGTKVLVTADHGFASVARDPISIDAGWLNEPSDCSYLNAWLRKSLREVSCTSEGSRERIGVLGRGAQDAHHRGCARSAHKADLAEAVCVSDLPASRLRVESAGYALQSRCLHPRWDLDAGDDDPDGCAAGEVARRGAPLHRSDRGAE